MSNASQALIMTAGILLGVLILALIVTLFASSSSLSTKYDEAKQIEAVQRYNADFSKYLSRDLTVHEVETICNLATDKGIEFVYKNKPGEKPAKEDIVGMYTTSANAPDYNVPKYRIEKVEFNENGYIIRMIIKDV